MSKHELESKTVQELRKIAFEQKRAGTLPAIPSAKILQLSKDELISYLIQEPNPNPTPEPTAPPCPGSIANWQWNKDKNVWEPRNPEPALQNVEPEPLPYYQQYKNRPKIEPNPEPKTTPETAKFEPQTPHQTTGNGDLSKHLAAAIAPYITAAIDEKKVDQIITARLKKFEEAISAQIAQATRPLEITIPALNIQKKAIGAAHHELFDQVLRALATTHKVMLVGPAGSGKTSLCRQIADALELKYYSQSVSIQTTKTDLKGYMDAHGRYVTTPLREAFEKGGLYLLDELDAGNANVIATINSTIENGASDFPDGMIERSPDFYVIAAANTFGRGADRLYVGRNQLDAATLDRFTVIYLDIDEKFERALANNDPWTDKVQKIRRAIYDLKERVICSPRASINGAALLAAGFTENQVSEMLIFKGINPELKAKILGHAKVNIIGA